MHTVSIPGTPWYRQLWPWLLISMPLTAVLAGIATWYIAWYSNDGLVADDYYKQGLEINRSIESQHLARQLGIAGELSQQDDKLILKIAAQRELSWPAKLNLSILSPVRAGEDRSLRMERVGDHYEAMLGTLTPGHWNLSLEDDGETWKILASGVFPLQGALPLHP